MRFANRSAAGKLLAEQVKADLAQQNEMPTLVLALPRGGVPVAYEVAQTLNAPLDLWLVRKIGVPGQEELAAGAIADGGVTIWNNDVLRYEGLRPAELQGAVARERAELDRRRYAYLGDHRPPAVKDKRVVLVDDGIATGASLFAAIESLHHVGASAVWVAVPVAPPDTLQRVREKVEGVTCLLAPENFRAVGMWYDDFSQTSDAEVLEILQRANRQWKCMGCLATRLKRRNHPLQFLAHFSCCGFELRILHCHHRCHRVDG